MSGFRLRCLDPSVSPDGGDKVATDPTMSPPVAGDKWRQTADLSPLSPLSPSPAERNASISEPKDSGVAACRQPDPLSTLNPRKAGDTATVATDPRLRSPSFRQQIVAARDAAPLADFREALILGRLVICGNCSRFTFDADPAGLGRCDRWDIEAFPFVPFYCAGFHLSRTPTAPAFVPDPEGSRERALEMARSAPRIQETPK